MKPNRLRRMLRPTGDCLPLDAPNAFKLLANRVARKAFETVTRRELGFTSFEGPLHIDGGGVFYDTLNGFYFRASGAGTIVGHESFQDTYMAERLEGGSVFIDVGAHVGRFTLLGARLVGEAGLVVALEPDPRVRRNLMANVKLNGFKNIVVSPVAASDMDGAECLHLSRTTGWSSLLKDAHKGTWIVNEVVVPASTLDTLARSLELKRVDLIKVDVEGADHRVLEGAGDILEKFSPALLVEVHPKTSWTRCKEIMEDNEYRYVVIHRNPRTSRHFHIYARKETQGG